MDGDEGGLPEREVDMPAQQGVERLRGIRRGHHPPAALVEQPLADVEQHLSQHGFLAREVPVQARAGHADGFPDVIDGHAVETAAGEQLGRRGEDLLAPQATARPYGTAGPNRYGSSPS